MRSHVASGAAAQRLAKVLAGKASDFGSISLHTSSNDEPDDDDFGDDDEAEDEEYYWGMT